MNKAYYQFEHFLLKDGRLIPEGSDEINLAPKENAVLQFLLQRAQQIIPKEEIIKHVWKGGVVSDESLSRCIYVLRRALGETKSKRFIETVYGKGYRFVSEVILLPEDKIVSEITLNNKANKKVNVALFPFELKSQAMSGFLYDQLVEWLQFHGSNFKDEFCFEIISPFLVRNCQHYNDLFHLAKKLNVDYYITGFEVGHVSRSVIRIELVRARDHTVLHREGVWLNNDVEVNYSTLCKLISVFSNMIYTDEVLGSFNKKNESSSFDIGTIQDDERHYPLPFIKQKISSLVKEKNEEVSQTKLWYSLANIYYAVANFVMTDAIQLKEETSDLLLSLLPLEKNNAIAYALQCLLVDNANEGDINAAVVLSPCMVEVYYYYACLLIKSGNIDKAQEINDICISLNEGFFESHILNVIICYLKNDFPSAIKYAESILDKKSAPFQSVIKALLVIIYAREGEEFKALQLFKKIEVYKSRCEFISYCDREVRAFLKKKKGNTSGIFSVISVDKASESITLPFNRSVF